MSIIPWKSCTPKARQVSEYESLQDQVNRFFNLSLFRWPEFSSDTYEGSWVPAVDVVESENNYTIKADLPGLKKEELSVSVDGDVLTIKGEKKEESESKEEGLIRRERSTGSFYRSVLLPNSVDVTQIKASYKNGVLELTAPKKEESKPNLIDIDVE